MTEEIGILVTGSSLQTSVITEANVIDLEACAEPVNVMVRLPDGKLEEVDIPKDCQFFKLMKVDGKIKAMPVS